MGVHRLFWWGVGIREFDPLQKWQVLNKMNLLKAVITALRNIFCCREAVWRS